MSNYIMALSINPEAKKNHHDLSHHVNESIEVFAKMELKVDNIYATLGRYDFLICFNADAHDDVFKTASEINSKGILKTDMASILDDSASTGTHKIQLLKKGVITWRLPVEQQWLLIQTQRKN